MVPQLLDRLNEYNLQNTAEKVYNITNIRLKKCGDVIEQTSDGFSKNVERKAE